jgi:FkbM family methyltransferase
MQPHLLMALAGQFNCDTFLDIGANVGAYSLLMSRVPGIAEVHAFEPSPDTFAHLQENVDLNRVNVKVYNLAASDTSSLLRFGIVNTFSGANSVVEGSLHKTFEREIEVQAVPLDDVLDLAGKRLCIKIDVEGHEPRVLRGMRNLLQRSESVLQIEDYASDAAEMDRRMASYGFEPLLRIGADRYFTNSADRPSERELINLFESACEALVQTNLGLLQQIYSDGEAPLDIRLSKSIAVQLKGTPARLARSLRRQMRSMVTKNLRAS